MFFDWRTKKFVLTLGIITYRNSRNYSTSWYRYCKVAALFTGCKCSFQLAVFICTIAPLVLCPFFAPMPFMFTLVSSCLLSRDFPLALLLQRVTVYFVMRCFSSLNVGGCGANWPGWGNVIPSWFAKECLCPHVLQILPMQMFMVSYLWRPMPSVLIVCICSLVLCNGKRTHPQP